jgi:hypothetical protein
MRSSARGGSLLARALIHGTKDQAARTRVTSTSKLNPNTPRVVPKNGGKPLPEAQSACVFTTRTWRLHVPVRLAILAATCVSRHAAATPELGHPDRRRTGFRRRPASNGAEHAFPRYDAMTRDTLGRLLQPTCQRREPETSLGESGDPTSGAADERGGLRRLLASADAADDSAELFAPSDRRAPNLWHLCRRPEPQIRQDLEHRTTKVTSHAASQHAC